MDPILPICIPIDKKFDKLHNAYDNIIVNLGDTTFGFVVYICTQFAYATNSLKKVFCPTSCPKIRMSFKSTPSNQDNGAKKYTKQFIKSLICNLQNITMP